MLHIERPVDGIIVARHAAVSRLRWSGRLPDENSILRFQHALIYKWTKNLRAGQLLLGNAKLENTVWYLGIEVDDALEISEQTAIQ